MAGTRKGVKCLHAHYAWHLAGGDDPIGRWVAERLSGHATERRGRHRLRHQLHPPAGGRRRRAPRSSGSCASPGSARASTPPGGWPTRPSPAPSPCCRSTAASSTATASTGCASPPPRPPADASNRDDFFAAATAAVGATPELLGGDEEARLSFLGATAELDPDDGPFLVADIGGGSTEFAVGTGGEPEGVLSTDIGCVRLTEKFLHSDPPAPEELSQAFDVVRGHLDDVARVIPAAAEARRFVGLAGTVTTMAAVELGLATYDRDRIHHFVLTRAAAEDVFRTLATETRRQRVHNPGLEEARADVIVGGAVIVCAIMRYFELQECLVSEADILDGLVLSLRP